MGAAGDVEEQATITVQRHQRRVAVAPVGNGFQEALVGIRLGGPGIKVWMAGAGFENKAPPAQARASAGAARAWDPMAANVAVLETNPAASPDSDRPIRGPKARSAR